MFDNKILYFLAFISLIGGIYTEYNLTIVHIGDFHSHWFEFNEKEGKCSDQESVLGKCFGGFPRLLNLVRDIRKKEKNVVVLSSGEFFLGRPHNPLHGWKIANTLVPRLELDAMSLANHDFGNGMLELSAFLYAMNFPVVCANMWAKETSFLHSRVNKSAIIDVNGERIGVVGYVHPDTLQKSKSVKSVKFTAEIPAIQEEVENLKRKGINKIIALGHSGYHIDLEIAKNVKDVDVVIGGNSDIVLEKTEDEDGITKGNIHGNYPRIHHYNNDTHQQLPSNKTLVLHVPQHGKYVGLMRLTFDDEGRVIHESGEPVLLDSSIPQDRNTLYFLNKASLTLDEINRHNLLPDYDDVLATVREDLASGKCRMAECALGNLVTDAMMDTYLARIDSGKDESEKWDPVDAVLLNSGSIRYPLQKGNITISDLIHSLYVGDFMKIVRMSGKQLRQMMEHSVKDFDPTGVMAPGTFLQVSGLRVTYDLNESPGNRVRKLTVRCQKRNGMYSEVKANKQYFVSMPNFIAVGGDGYPVHEADDSQNVGHPEILLILEYLTKINEVIPLLDGRISFQSTHKSPNLKNENSTYSSNTTTLLIPLSPTTSISFKGENQSKAENNHSYNTFMTGNISKKAISVTPNEELSESNKLYSSVSSLNESFSTNTDNIKYGFEKNAALPFWWYYLMKPKHTIVARKYVMESSFPVEKESSMVNNYTKNIWGDAEVIHNYSHHAITPFENKTVPYVLKNATSQYEVYSMKDNYVSPSKTKIRTERIVPERIVPERIVPERNAFHLESNSHKLENNDDNNSFIFENNVEANVRNLIIQNELNSPQKFDADLNNTIFSPMRSQSKNKLPENKIMSIENNISLHDSKVNHNHELESRRTENTNIFESMILDAIVEEAGHTILNDDKRNLLEGNSIPNNSLNDRPILMSSTNFRGKVSTLNGNSEENDSEETMISILRNATLLSQVSSTIMPDSLSRKPDASTNVYETEDTLAVKAKANIAIVEFSHSFADGAINKNQTESYEDRSGIRIVDRNINHTTINKSYASNLANENVKSGNGIVSNFIDDVNKNVEIEKSSLDNSIANITLNGTQNSTAYSNLNEDTLKDVQFDEQTLKHIMSSTTHEFENSTQTRNFTEINVRDGMIKGKTTSDTNVNFKTDATLFTSQSSNSLKYREDTSKIPQDFDSTSTIVNDNINKNLTLFADIQDDQNSTDVEREIYWFPWFF